MSKTLAKNNPELCVYVGARQKISAIVLYCIIHNLKCESFNAYLADLGSNMQLDCRNFSAPFRSHLRSLYILKI